MKRQSIFERMKRELDFTKEYLKLDYALCNEIYTRYGNSASINDIFESNFRQWKFRDNYLSLNELRNELGFYPSFFEDQVMSEDSFFQFCELIINLAVAFENRTHDRMKESLEAIIETLVCDLAKVNYCIEQIEDGRFIVAEKCAAATAVSEVVPVELSDKVIEYNHYLLRGDIAAKREILFSLASYLEPKRKTLQGINGALAANVFFLVNNLNIRHNNCEAGANYKKYVAEMSSDTLELWYDETYQTILYAILSLDQSERNLIIEELKTDITESN